MGIVNGFSETGQIPPVWARNPDLKAIVSVTLAGKPAEQARFTPLAAVGAGAAKAPAPAADPHAAHKH